METPTVLSIVALGISIVLFIIECVLACYLNRVYGDVAGAKLIIESEKERVAKARVSALQSSVNEVERIRKLASYSSELTSASSSKPPVRMPTAAFETAFVSGTSGLAVSEDLLEAVTDYLACADRINIFNNIYVSGVPSGESAARARMNTAAQEVGTLCTDTVPGILDWLSQALERELEVTRA